MLEKIGLEAVMNMGQFNQGMHQYNQGISGMDSATASAVASMNAKLSSLGAGTVAMGNMISSAVKGAAGALKNEFVGAYQKVADQERMELSLRSMLTKEYMRSTETQMDLNTAREAAVQPAADLLKWVEKLGAQSPFESTQIAQSVKMSMSFGATADQAKKLTSELVDFAAATGKDASTISQLGVVMGQIRGAGKLMGQDMMQLVGAGVPVTEILGKMGLGMADVSAGLVKSDAFFNAFSQTVKESGWEGEAIRQSSSLAGLGSTLEEFVSNTKRNLSKGVWQALQGPMAAALGFITSEENQQRILDIGASIGTFVSQAIQPLGTALEVLASGGSFQEIFGALLGADMAAQAQPIIDMFGVIAISVGEVINAVQSGAGLDVILGNIGQGLGAIADRIVAFVTGGEQADILVDLLGQSFNAFGDGIASMSANVTKNFSAIGKIILDTVGKVGPSLLKLLPIASSLMATYGKMTADITSFFLQKIGPAVTKLTDIFNTNFPKIALAVTSALGTIQRLWESVWPRLQNIISTVMAQIGPLITRATEIIVDLATRGAATFEVLRPHIERLAQKIEEEFIPVIKDMGKWAMEVFDKIQAWIDANWPTIESILIKLVDFITNSVIPVIKALWENTLKPFFTGALDGFMTFATGVLKILDGDLKGGLEKIWEGIKGVFNAAIEGLLGIIETFFGKGIREKIEGAAGVVITAVTQFVEGFVGAMKEKWEGLVTAWNIASAVVRKVSELKSAGEDLVGGLLAGLRDAWDSVTRWFGSALDSIPAWMRNLLGMGAAPTPSTGSGGGSDPYGDFGFAQGFAAVPSLMEQLGRDSILGLIAGMTDAERDIVARSTEIAQAVVEAFRAVLELGNMEVPTLTLDRLNAMADAYAEAFTRIVAVMRGVYNGEWVSSTGVRYAPGGGGVYEAGTAFGISGGVQDLIETMRSTLELLTSLAEVDFPADLGTRLASLADNYALAVTAIVEAANDLTASEVNAAAVVLPGTAALLDVVRPAIDALAALMTYEPLEGDYVTLARRFRIQLAFVVNTLSHITDELMNVAIPDAAGIVNTVLALVGLIRPGMDALAALITYEPLEGNYVLLARRFRIQLAFVVNTLADITDELMNAALPEAAAMAGYIESIVGVIKPGIDALTTLFTYTTRSGIESLALSFASDLGAVISSLADAFVGEGGRLASAGIDWEDVYAGAEVFYAAVANIVAVVQPAIDALKAMATYELMVGLPTLMENFSQNLMIVASWLAAAFNFQRGFWGRQGVDWRELYGDAATFYEYVGQMVGIVKQGVDALNALTGYTTVTGLEARAHAFAADLIRLAQWLRAAFTYEAGMLGQQGADWRTLYSDAAAFYGYVQGIVGVVKPGLDAIKDLTDYVQVEGLAESATAFAADIMAVMGNLKRAFEGWLYNQGEGWQELMASAVEFYGYISGMVAIVKPGIDAITSLYEYERAAGVSDSADAFALDIIEIMGNLKRAFEGWLYNQGEGWQELMGQAAAFYTSISSIIGIVKPGLDAIADLAAYVRVEEIAVKAGQFTDDLLAVAEEMRLAVSTQASRFGEGVWGALLVEAATFFNAIKEIIGAIKPAVDALTALGEYTRQEDLATKIGWFVTDMGTFFTALESLTGTASEAALLAGAFLTTAKAILTEAKATADLLVQIAAYRGPEGGFVAAIGRFTTDLGAFFTALDDAAEDMQDTLSGTGAITQMGRAAQRIYEGVRGALSTIASITAATGGAQSALQDFREALGVELHESNRIIEYWMGRMMGTLIAQQSNWYSAGAALGQSFAAGLAATMPSILPTAGGSVPSGTAVIPVSQLAGSVPPSSGGFASGGGGGGNSTVVNVNFNGVNVNNGMDLAALEARINQTVSKSLRR